MIKYSSVTLNFIVGYVFFLRRISEEDYVKAIKEEIKKVVDLQEELDIDVLVHGEPEVSCPLLPLYTLWQSFGSRSYNSFSMSRHLAFRQLS